MQQLIVDFLLLFYFIFKQQNIQMLKKVSFKI